MSSYALAAATSGAEVITWWRSRSGRALGLRGHRHVLHVHVEVFIYTDICARSRQSQKLPCRRGFDARVRSAAERNAQRHIETLNDIRSSIRKRRRVDPVLERGNFCRAQILVKHFRK